MGNRLKEVEIKRMELMELKDTFMANRFRLCNIQEMEQVITKFQRMEEKVKGKEMSEGEIWQLSRQYKRNKERLDKVISKYQVLLVDVY